MGRRACGLPTPGSRGGVRGGRGGKVRTAKEGERVMRENRVGCGILFNIWLHTTSQTPRSSMY